MKKPSNQKRSKQLQQAGKSSDRSEITLHTGIRIKLKVLLFIIFFISLFGSIVLSYIFFKTGKSGYVVTIFFYMMMISGFIIAPINKKILKFNIVAILLILFISESYLRISKKGYLDYMEQNSTGIFGNYLSKYYEYSGIRDGVYWLHAPNSSYIEKKTEFTQKYDCNSIGLRDRPLADFKNNASNILVLGDSFTEGVGCPQNQTTPSEIEREINKICSGKNIKVLNGGVSGSDLFFSYKLMERLYPIANPKIVILNINTSDIDDIICRGGEERFRNNSVRYVNFSPWWEYFYSFSYIFRTISNEIFHTNPVLYSRQRTQDINYLKIIYDKVLQYNDYCNKRNIKFVFVVSPILKELAENNFSFDELVQVINNNTQIHTINLKDIFLQKKYITKTNYTEYYYLQDYHFKPKGYQLAGDIIAADISKYCN